MSSRSIIVSVEEAALDEQGAFYVSGWAAGLARVERIEVVVAGVRLGEAEFGRSRSDVAADHPEFVDAAHCGFAFSGMLEERARQAQQAFVIVHAEGQAETATVKPIARAQALASAMQSDAFLRFHCDNLALYDDGHVEIGGWAAHIGEVERIEVSLDGAPLGEAQIGGHRPDVAKSHPAIPTAARSGFTFRATVEELAAGEHEASLAIFTRQGDRFVRRLTAATQIARDSARAADRQDIRLFIDSPKVVDGELVEPVRRMLAIEGWAVARHGVAAVELFLDGAPVGVASRGVRRLDIAAAYPDWPDSLMSGYAILLPRKVFAKEKHVLRLAVRDHRGGVKETEVNVTVEPADLEDERSQLRTFVSQAEVDLKTALLAASAERPAFAVLIAPGETQDGLARTLESLAAQAYRDFEVGFLAPSPEAALEAEALAGQAGLFLRIVDAQEDLELADAVEALVAGAAAIGRSALPTAEWQIGHFASIAVHFDHRRRAGLDK